MFGVVNAFFSACAFAGIIFTILLQREELELQREELKLTRAELKRSALAQEKSEYALSCQAKAANLSAQLSSISHLIQYTNSEIEPLQQMRSRGLNVQDCNGKLDVLMMKRQKLFAQLSEAHEQATQQTTPDKESE